MKKLIVAILLIISIGFVLSIFSRGIHKQDPIWLLEPGYFGEEEVEEIVGNPDSIEQIDELFIYRYNNHWELGGWRKVAIWLQKTRRSERILFILLHNPVVPKGSVIPSSTINKLSLLTDRFGKPDDVFWRGCLSRFLIWQEGGVGIGVTADRNANELTGNNIFIYDVVLFDPSLLEDITEPPWGTEYAIPLTENPCYFNTDAPDLNPIDPFNWNLIMAKFSES